ncbi:acyl-CoA thioesterase II [Novosphingobium sp.]|uniref:acyl-CoA thioesterase n=1 Tax=Novosphingobium sp. TaxID=1874826 RepID=UPI0025DE80AF|nr:acyl-CoA thioesterase II [Novosphingobium sp.]
MSETATPEQLVDGLIRLLDVTPTGDDHFAGRRKPGGVGRVFGGQVIAQALAAAERTVADANRNEERPVHSLHAYFLRGGNEDHEIDFRIDRDLDGGSFSNRRVTASQQANGQVRPILTLSASFQRREQGVHHSDTMPDVLPPDAVPSEAELREQYASSVPEHVRQMMLIPRPIEMRHLEPRHWMGAEPSAPVSNTWFRAAAPLPNDPKLHRAVLAYATDMTLLGTCALPHGLSWTLGNLMGVSLDHAIWFHDPDVKADEWLLYACDSPWADRARGFNRGKIFAQDGRLVAEVAQEGLIRKIVPKGS